MIITLKNADFSKSNIGTLDSWTVRVAGSHITYTDIKSIKKKDALNMTITIDEGYELGEAGVTVTMGGTTQSGVATVNGNTITVAIGAGSVTGNVVINVPTKNITTGEEDDGNEEPDTPDTPDTPSGSGERVYTINETLKFNDMPEVASTFISDSYYKATDGGNPGSKLTVEVRSGYKAWKNIRIYAGQSYALNPDARAICFYDADENAFDGFNLKNTYSDGIIPAEVITQDGWMSVTVTSSVSDNSCTIKRIS